MQETGADGGYSRDTATADAVAVNALIFRRKAAGLRRLAADILAGEFRRKVLELALEYERRAMRLDRLLADRTVTAID